MVGNNGAGTIFFTGCNLKCVFCQNWQISHGDLGKDYSIEELANIMLKLQDENVANIDLVTPTPWRRQIKKAIILAKEKGLKIPIAWNSNGYENVAAIRDMTGLIDIYLPDFKYADDKAAEKYSHAPNYMEVAEKAIREMYAQVGLLQIDKNGLAKKGLIIRHLILPENLSNTLDVLNKIAAIDKNIHLSLMSQYYPIFDSAKFPEINRQVSNEEIKTAEIEKLALGLKNGWVQESDSGEVFLPDFGEEKPFEK